MEKVFSANTSIRVSFSCLASGGAKVEKIEKLSFCGLTFCENLLNFKGKFCEELSVDGNAICQELLVFNSL